MKKIFYGIVFLLFTFSFSGNLNAQCPTITCPGDITLNNDAGTCGAVVNYATPVGIDNCSNGNILFVCDGDNTTTTEIPAELTAAGYNVTSVYSDHNATTKDNATLQSAGLSNYKAIFWHASGNNGYGDTHSAATFTNLSAYVNAGGKVFITGYDVIASPTDVELYTFMGGTGSIDGGYSGNATLVGSNSLTTGVTNIVGLTLSVGGDHDGLTGLTAGTVAVASSGTNHGWTIRTLGAGEIAWVSTANPYGTTWAYWNTPGSGYNEALLNFAYNACYNPNILFVCDGDNTTATEIPAELTAAGYNVTAVYSDHNATTKDNATLQGAGLSMYSAIYWHASGNSGYGDTHSAATFANLSAYVSAGGNVFITGYDVIASPPDPELITFMGGTSSTDGGSVGTETLVGSNSLTTGVTNIVGLTLNATGDHDGLNGLDASTVAVASNGSSHGWTIRTLGAGEIAWVSTANYTAAPWAYWNTPGTGYNEALLNFAYNHTSIVGIGLPTTTMIAGLADGATFPVGATTVTYEVVDGLGNNPEQCSFIVTIVDNEAPVADVATLADVTAECEVTTLTAPTATDNCGTVTVTNDATLPISAQGTTVVTWTYNDGNGNTASQTQNVVITDISAPVADVATLADVTAECEVTTLTAPTATDNCGTVTVTNDATLPISTQG
ncbi:MAG: HYR domain-containing protein, partial [Bacteroidales bacterium]|nr:HYR domain-containing protein [Bacteroidales bacterium]